MKQMLLTSALAFALAFGPMAAQPARADAEATARIVAGLATLYIIGRALDRGSASAQPSTSQTLPATNDFFRARPEGRVFVPREPVRVLPRGHAKRALPAECFVSYRTNRGLRGGYARRCLERSVRRPNLLPQACLQTTGLNRGPRVVYAAPCLRRAGFVEARHRD